MTLRIFFHKTLGSCLISFCSFHIELDFRKIGGEEGGGGGGEGLSSVPGIFGDFRFSAHSFIHVTLNRGNSSAPENHICARRLLSQLGNTCPSAQ